MMGLHLLKNRLLEWLSFDKDIPKLKKALNKLSFLLIITACFLPAPFAYILFGASILVSAYTVWLEFSQP